MPDANAVAQGAHLAALQLLFEFGLSDQQQGKQFLFFCFQVGKQPQAFEYGWTQPVRLIHQHCHTRVGGSQLDQDLQHVPLHRRFAFHVWNFFSKIVNDAAHQLDETELRVKNISGAHAIRQIPQQVAAQQGLA